MFDSDNGTSFVEKYENEYNFNYKDGLTLKPTASKEAIKALLLYELSDKDFFQYKDLLVKHLVSEFKKTECYKLKSKEEQEEIIQYLLNTDFENKKEDNTIYTDENGNDILV